MKMKQGEKKLVLKKQTIERLEDVQLNDIKGGTRAGGGINGPTITRDYVICVDI